MSYILLTPAKGSILGPIANILGKIMSYIYIGVYKITGVENIGLSIFLLTVFIYTCLLPLTYKQQKFSKLNQRMQPEMNAIREKYAGKKDQASMNAMNQETQLLYEKYGVSPAGSCVQMIIQMPILLALYRVFNNVPAYVVSVKDQFSGMVDGIISNNYVDKMADIVSDYKIAVMSNPDWTATGDTLRNYIVDVLYKIPSNKWAELTDYFPNMDSVIGSTMNSIENFNYIFNIGSFNGLNISDTPFSIIKNNFTDRPNMWFLYAFIAFLVPACSYLSQLLSIKLMPTTDTGNDQMAQQMKTMNMMMPLVSLFFCFNVPVGLGIYWVFSAVYRCVQQFVMNKHFEKIDLDDIILKNQEKAKKKREKRGIAENQIRDAASMKTKTMGSRANISYVDKELELEKANAKKSNAKAGSMAAKANMVKEFNERNSRK